MSYSHQANVLKATVNVAVVFKVEEFDFEIACTVDDLQ